MDKRTANIIWICKGHHNYGNVTLKQAVAQYMCEVCGFDTYSEEMLRAFVSQAFFRYLKVCTDISIFMSDIQQAKYYAGFIPRDGVDDTLAILIAFQICKVKGEYGCVNGFTEELIAELDERWEKDDITDSGVCGVEMGLEES